MEMVNKLLFKGYVLRVQKMNLKKKDGFDHWLTLAIAAVIVIGLGVIFKDKLGELMTFIFTNLQTKIQDFWRLITVS